MEGLRFVASLMASGDPKNLMAMETDVDMFLPSEKAVWGVVRSHVHAHGDMPSPEAIEAALEYKVEWPPAPDSPSYYLAQMRARYVQRRLGDAMTEAAKEMKAKTVVAADEGLRILGDCVLDLYLRDNRAKLHDFRESLVPVIKAYVASFGTGGVKTGWPYLDGLMGGMGADDVVTYVGRPGRGKTFSLLYAALHAWGQGFPVLFVSMEMTPVSILQRLAATHTHTALTKVTRGLLTTPKFSKLKDDLKALEKAPVPLWVVDGNLTATVEDIWRLAKRLEAGAIYIDGAYHVEVGGDRWVGETERITRTTNQIKLALAGDLKVPVFQSHQLSREAAKKVKKKKTDEIDLEDIGYCLRGDQVVTTSGGMMRVEDAYRRGCVAVFDGLQEEPAEVVATGEKEEWLVTFEDGTELACSPDHRVWAHSGGVGFEWVAARHLRRGDAGLVHGPSFQGIVPEVTAAQERGYFDVGPLVMTPEVSELMGLLVGDGATVDRQTWSLSVCGKDLDVFDRVQSVLWGTWSYEGKVKAKTDEHLYVQIMAKGIIDQMTEMGMPRLRSPHKYAPRAVLLGTPILRGAFVRGLFEADGSCGAKGGLRLSTTSFRLAQDVQILLRSLGIVSYVTRKDKTVASKAGYPSQWVSYYVWVPVAAMSAFENQVGFVSARKKAVLREAIERPGYRPRYAYADRYDRPLSVLRVESSAATGRNVFMYDVVKDGGEHRFLANGIVVHNSDRIGQISSAVIALLEEETVSTLVQRQVTILKDRYGGKGVFDIRWDFDTMDFGQISDEEQIADLEVE